jgi:catechol 2,3-dioxygenase-like lactoylglutathione lyase family enzyme
MSLRVEGLDHVNIRTPDVVGTGRFFAEVLGMEVRPTPGIPDPARAAWLYDGEGRAAIHLGAGEITYPWESAPAMPGAGSGRVHHVALRCTGYPAIIERLNAQGRTFHVNELPQIGLRQVYVQEPNGIMLELNFFET